MRPLVQLVRHDHTGDETHEEHPGIRMLTDVEEEEDGDQHGRHTKTLSALTAMKSP